MMNTYFRSALLMGTALLASVAAQGPWQDSYRYGRGNSIYGSPGGRYVGDPVTNAMRDLENIFRRARVDRHEADHFRDALNDLNRFRSRASGGRFDRGALDHAIDEMKNLARADQLHPRDREIIARNINELRYLRDRGFAGNGYRGW